MRRPLVTSPRARSPENARRTSQITRRGFLLLAGASLAACTVDPEVEMPSPVPTASLAAAARTPAASPAPAAVLRMLFPCAPLPGNSDRIAGIVRAELGDRKGTYGVSIQHLDTGESYLQNGDRPLPSASLYKLSVLYEAWRQIGLGKMTLDTKLTILDEDVVEGEPDDGIELGEEYSLATVMDRMITVSSNAAAYCLFRTLGRTTINQSVADLGLLDTRLIVSGVRTGVYDGDGDEVASTSPRDMLTYFRLLGNGYLLGAEWSKGMREILLKQQVNDRIPALLPPNTPVAHKTGELTGVRNDAGIVYSPKGAYAIAVLASDVDEADATSAIASLSRKIYDLFVAS